jgi:polyribonucleotide nucleotidyltransferase
MGQQIPITTTFNLPDGRPVTLETGKLAALADGSVVVRVGDTMIFAVVNSAKEMKEGQSFFPLSVDYQEKFAAAGRIPGNFFRRETKLSDYEVLISRLVDRACRPLFPDNYMNETQIIINLLSSDHKEMPDCYAALAASAALAVSDIPFEGPISEVRVARIDGEYRVNPLRSELERADLDIMVGATYENIMMVEGEAKECLEVDLITAIKVAHEAIKVQCQAIRNFAQLVGDKATIKRQVAELPEDESLKKEVEKLGRDQFFAIASSASDKQTRKKKFKEIEDSILAHFKDAVGTEYLEANQPLIARYISKLQKDVVRKMILDTGVRLDGRSLDTVRPIWTEIDYLPGTHGSAIFTRGETQSLTSLTLGTKLDEQMIDNALGLYFEKFILHYNFPGYSVGEVKPMRAPGRREVGHANLAARSLRKVLPAFTEQPYTIRLVSDILESNGSSSMATVCAGSLALMDGGIQIKAPVAGIAMGLISEDGRHAVLTDILGDEDALGDMDFKVTGTTKGICGCQMDIKIDGMPYEWLETALEQARKGRLHILKEMDKTISTSREDLKPHAPRIFVIEIDKSFIGAVIGPGGKIIQDIQATTGTVVSIEEKDNKGIVSISSPNLENIEKAKARVRSIIYEPQVGDEFEATIKSIMPYGAFIEYMPGKEGLLHISEISYARLDTMDDVFQLEDKVRVKLIKIDEKTGKLSFSRKVLMPKPEGYVEPERTERPPRRDFDGDRRNDRGGDRRGGDRDRRNDRDRDRRDRY